MSNSDSRVDEQSPASLQEAVKESKPQALKIRKWLLVASLVGNAALGLTLIVALQKPKPKAVDQAKYTQQDVGKAMAVSAGMSAASVKSLLGEPVVRELSAGREEWHYCRTGTTTDEYVAVSFRNDKVDGLQYYTVSWLDTAFHYVKQPTEKLLEVGGLGDCRLTVRWGTYGQRTPSYPERAPARDRNVEIPVPSASAKPSGGPSSSAGMATP